MADLGVSLLLFADDVVAFTDILERPLRVLCGNQQLAGAQPAAGL